MSRASRAQRPRAGVTHRTAGRAGGCFMRAASQALSAAPRGHARGRVPQFGRRLSMSGRYVSPGLHARSSAPSRVRAEEELWGVVAETSALCGGTTGSRGRANGAVA